MTKILYVLATVACLIATINAQCAFNYTVQSGDYVTGIASRYGLLTSTLLTANPAINATTYMIYVGQVLCIPVGSQYPGVTVGFTQPASTVAIQPVTSQYCSLYYVVSSSSETCSTILATYPGFSYAASVPTCQVAPGQVVCVSPGPNYNPNDNSKLSSAIYGCSLFYVVNSGDTCSSIGHQYPYVFTLNKNINCAGLSQGEALCVSNYTTVYTTVNYYNCGLFYSASPADNCNSINQRFPLAISANSGLNCNSIPATEKICALPNYNPINPAPVNCNTNYTIVNNDTCYNIATSRNFALSHLLSCNPTLNCSNLIVGTTIVF